MNSDIKVLSEEELIVLENSGQWPLLVTARKNRREDSKYISKERSTSYFALLHENEVIGICGLEQVQPRLVYLGPLEIRADRRKQGLGSLFLALLQVSARKQEFNLFLYSPSDLIGFYESSGFIKGKEVEESYYEMVYDINCLGGNKS